MSGRRAMVCGAASGIGEDVVHALRRRGDAVAAVDVAGDALAKLRTADAELVTRELDVSDVAAVRAVVPEVADALGGLDTLIITAGVAVLEPLEEVEPETWDRIQAVNLRGAFFVCQAATPSLRRSGRGRIVTVSSAAGRRGYPWTQAYCASKFGLIGMTESLAAELAPDRVTVNCVCPATVPTTGMGRDLLRLKAERSGSSEAEVLEELAASYPLGRYVEERDVTEAIAFLASDEAGFITGVSLDVAGGEALGARASLTKRPPA